MGMSITSRCIGGRSVAQQQLIDLLMALRGRHEADRDVPVGLVVPMHELRHPATRLQRQETAWKACRSSVA